METSRVQKFIAKSGYCSRRKAEKLIEEGKVKVNNKPVKLGDQCFETDEITISNKKIHFDMSDLIYIILNKKTGYVTTKSDEFNRKTIFDLINKKDKKKDLFSVGRLDKDTTGLIILTNDGQLSQKIIHPSKKIDKEYLVKLDKELMPKSKQNLEKGIRLDKYQLKPCKIALNGPKQYIVTISEGRKRQIRRMFEKEGYLVTSLHREKIGALALTNIKLQMGEYKKVSKKFLEKWIFN